MKLRHIRIASSVANVLLIAGFLVLSPVCFGPPVPPGLIEIGLLLLSASVGLRGTWRFILRRQEKHSPRNAVQPSGVSCYGFLDVGTPVLAPLYDEWFRAKVVAVDSEDRCTVRFDGASPFWDETYARTALQEPTAIRRASSTAC